MKWILIALAIAFSSSAFAGRTGGVPSVPCYIDGKMEGTIPINECHRRGGKVPGEK